MTAREVVKFLKRGTPRSQRMLGQICDELNLQPKKAPAKAKPKAVSNK